MGPFRSRVLWMAPCAARRFGPELLEAREGARRVVVPGVGANPVPPAEEAENKRQRLAVKVFLLRSGFRFLLIFSPAGFPRRASLLTVDYESTENLLSHSHLSGLLFRSLT